MNYVIVGAGPAGVTAAEAIRSVDKTGSITIVSGEPEPPYSRMAIPYHLHGNIAESGMYLRQNPDHYHDLNINYQHGVATGIDTAGKKLVLYGGSVVPYDKLLIATGASPILPPIKGSDFPGVVNCWTMEDARKILEQADAGSPVVLVGAGFIGCIVLEALHQRGCDLTVVEFAPRMVARMLDDVAGNMLERWSEAKGVKVYTSTKVEAIEPGSGCGGSRFTVGLSDGNWIPAKLVVLAAGVRPNISFLEGTGIATNQGITVNQFLQTSAPDVYAAGDCCEGIDLSTGKPDMLAIQPVAVEHGRIAGLNMAGRPTPHRGSLNMNVLDTMGLISSSFGLWQGVEGGDTARLIDEEGFKYLKLNFDGDRLVGAQCVGLTDHVGMLRGLIQTEFPLGKWKDKLMQQPELLRQAYLAAAQGGAISGPLSPHVNTPLEKPAA